MLRLCTVTVILDEGQSAGQEDPYLSVLLLKCVVARVAIGIIMGSVVQIW